MVVSFCCPITQELMQEPVVAADGHVYERRAIEEWFRCRHPPTSPLTGQQLSSLSLTPCEPLRRALAEYQHQRPELLRREAERRWLSEALRLTTCELDTVSLRERAWRLEVESSIKKLREALAEDRTRHPGAGRLPLAMAEVADELELTLAAAPLRKGARPGAWPSAQPSEPVPEELSAGPSQQEPEVTAPQQEPSRPSEPLVRAAATEEGSCSSHFWLQGLVGAVAGLLLVFLVLILIALILRLVVLLNLLLHLTVAAATFCWALVLLLDHSILG